MEGRSTERPARPSTPRAEAGEAAASLSRRPGSRGDPASSAMKGAAGTTGQTYGRPEDQTTPSTLATRAWSVSVSENVRMLRKN